jgi:3'(2'), 5'-bisphosphate nucleotidase
VYLNTSGHTWEWDTCAPEAILAAAGGRITDMTNMPLRYNRPDPRNPNGLVASNNVIHDRIIEAVRSVVGI